MARFAFRHALDLGTAALAHETTSFAPATAEGRCSAPELKFGGPPTVHSLTYEFVTLDSLRST